MEKLVAAPKWISENYPAVLLREEDAMRREEVCAATSVSYLDPDVLSGEESGHGTQNAGEWQDSGGSESE